MTDTYYKARISYTPAGICVVMDEFKVIHETKCIAYCVYPWQFDHISWRADTGETKMQTAKRVGIKVLCIHKTRSRIAQPTHEKAFDRLKFLKQRQVRHLKRELDLLTLFNSKTSGQELSALNKQVFNSDTYLVPDTEENTNIYFNFGWDY